MSFIKDFQLEKQIEKVLKIITLPVVTNFKKLQNKNFYSKSQSLSQYQAKFLKLEFVASISKQERKHKLGSFVNYLIYGEVQ